MPSRARRLLDEQRRAQKNGRSVPPKDAPPPPVSKDNSMASPPNKEIPQFWVRFVIPGQGTLTYRGTHYDYGEILTMGTTPRDEQLVRLGYVYPADKAESHLHAECGVCGSWFLTEYYRDMHGRRRHQHRFGDDDLDVAAGMTGPDGGAALRDITGDAEERRLMQENPLFLEKTRASQQG